MSGNIAPKFIPYKERKAMCKIISLFNHKGGVSKTTTTFNLGWALADLGYRTLIVDADPQCNLTGTVLGFNAVEDLENFYDKKSNSDLYNCIKSIIEGRTTTFTTPDGTETRNKKLFLLAGHINLGEVEGLFGVSLKTSKALPVMQNLPGLLNKVIRKTASKNNIDIVLVDMSPSIGALNQCVLMGSDFFIIPTSPDYFCNQAMWSLSKTLPNWNTDIAPFRDKNLENSFPDSPPKFIGIISQKYRPRKANPAKSFQNWIDVIKETTNTSLVKELNKFDMVISESQFRDSCTEDTPYNLANIPDFNSLIAISQEHNTPVFALSKEQINRSGMVLEQMIASRDEFLVKFSTLAKSVSKIVGLTT